jgi:hypothetical protein
MSGRAEEFPERSHRHPAAWWEMRCRWLDEAGAPLLPAWKSCGRAVHGMEYMTDEFPAQTPEERTKVELTPGHEERDAALD